MDIYRTEVRINAPLAKVFQTISNPEEFAKAVPAIERVEFLTKQKSGEGTKFRETRKMRNREVSAILEITEVEENDNIRMVSESGGTIWDSHFTIEEENDGIHLLLTMQSIPKNMLARMMNRMIKSTLEKAIAEDLVAVKNYCEKSE